MTIGLRTVNLDTIPQRLTVMEDISTKPCQITDPRDRWDLLALRGVVVAVDSEWPTMVRQVIVFILLPL